MTPDAEPAPSISEQIQEKFRKPLLAATAKLPKNSTLENHPQLLNEVMGDPTLACRQHPTYSIGDEAEVLLHYKLEGTPEIFQEHLNALLGDQWRSEGQVVTVPLFPDGVPERPNVPELLEGHTQYLLGALARYHAELSDARRKLRVVVERALGLRSFAENLLGPAGIGKEPTPETPRFRPTPRRRNHGL